MITYSFLQQYWWLLVSLLGGLLVFLMFVQGANTLIFRLGTDEAERTLIVNSTGRKWEFYLYDACHVWWCLLCFLPFIL